MFALCAEENALTPALSRRTGEGEISCAREMIFAYVRSARALAFPSPIGWERARVRVAQGFTSHLIANIQRSTSNARHSSDRHEASPAVGVISISAAMNFLTAERGSATRSNENFYESS
jgi:hypothetical protein